MINPAITWTEKQKDGKADCNICPLIFFKVWSIIRELAFICAEMIDSYFVNYVDFDEMVHLSHLIKIYIFCHTILLLFCA